MIPIPNRLAVRIYLVTVLAVMGPVLAGFLFVKIAWAPPRHEPFPSFARYAAAKLAQRWSSPAGLREELAGLRAESGLEGAAYRWDGGLLAGAGPGTPPLTAEERELLARDGALERHGPGGFVHVVVVRSGGEPVGYVALRPGRPPRDRPPPPGAVPFVLVLVALAIAAAVLGSAIARPLDKLAQAARSLGAGDLSARTGVSSKDELGAVARAFDEMADRMVGLLRSQTELLANVAHELRTPLARIRVALDLAEDGEEEEARASLGEIATDLAELERLVTDILDTARMNLAGPMQGGAPPLRRSAVALAHVVEEATRRLEQAYPGRPVEATLAQDLPVIEGDAVLLRRALDNLLENARKHSPPDSLIEIRARRRGDDVLLQVVDHGEGMAPEDVGRLFTPFFRADRSRNRQTGGVGLGLTLTRRIVEAHGGTIAAESAPGVGTTMTITLPGARPVVSVT